MEYETLKSSINKITLTKEEEKAEYIPQFIKLYGNPEAMQIVAEDSYYLNKMRETVKQLEDNIHLIKIFMLRYHKCLLKLIFH